MPEGGLQIHGAAISHRALHAPQHLAGLHRLVAAGPCIASRHEATVRPMCRVHPTGEIHPHQAMRDQSFILAEYDDRTWLQFG